MRSAPRWPRVRRWWCTAASTYLERNALPDLHRRAHHRPHRAAAGRARHLGRPSRLPPPHAGPGALGRAHDRAPPVRHPARPACGCACTRSPRAWARHRGPAGAVGGRLADRRQRGRTDDAGPDSPSIGACTIERALQVELSAAVRLVPPSGGRRPPVRRPGGSVLWVRVEAGPACRSHPRGRRSADRRTRAGSWRMRPAAALPGTGRPAAAQTPLRRAGCAGHRRPDDALLAVERARRVIDKPIALLLQGESGVGKEVFARAVHASGSRRDGPFVAVNCAALPECADRGRAVRLPAGAFTGAQPRRRTGPHPRGPRRHAVPGRDRRHAAVDAGAAAACAAGPAGGAAGRRQPVAVDFRLVCATHRRLRHEMDRGASARTCTTA
jgi:hypothetical protein